MYGKWRATKYARLLLYIQYPGCSTLSKIGPNLRNLKTIKGNLETNIFRRHVRPSRFLDIGNIWQKWIYINLRQHSCGQSLPPGLYRVSRKLLKSNTTQLTMYLVEHHIKKNNVELVGAQQRHLIFQAIYKRKENTLN